MDKKYLIKLFNKIVILKDI